MFDGKLYLTRDICKHDQMPEQLKVPVKSNPTKPAAKRAGNRAAQLTSSSNPQPIPELPTEHVQEFKAVWSCKKKFHTVPVERARTQKEHHVSMRFTLPMLCMHSCRFKVLRFGGAPPPPTGGEPSLHTPPPPWGGTITTLGGDYKGGVR